MKTLKIIIVFIMLANLGQAQKKSVLLDSLFQTMHERSQFSGNVLIAEQGETIYQNNLGYADRNTQAPLRTNTLFNTGSISKAFTALAIQQLAEKKHIKLKEPAKSPPRVSIPRYYHPSPSYPCFGFAQRV